MTARRYLVTGGTGFLGSALVQRLVRRGHTVRVIDNNSRGNARRLRDIDGHFEFIQADIRDAAAVSQAVARVDSVLHLAYVNGTEFFYSKPELVLDVGVRGMLNVIDACLAHNVGDLVLASSSEVYQAPPMIPTPEDVPLVVPDVFNPRYSYGGGKIISELLAVNYGRKHFQRVAIFRPHNVYGPDMGFEHVVPQFAVRLKRLADANPGTAAIPFPIQGTGEEQRAFIYVDDFIDGVMLVVEKGAHQNVYHVGNPVETRMSDVARAVAEVVGRKIEIVPGPPAPGGVTRRCPDVAKLSALGFRPTTTLRAGLEPTVRWYVDHAAEAP